ncbi:MAG: thiamine phosphate synthase [Alphaproteobacteria bacterium]|nr:thiamine phosphate synthase [Pseudomonadota bacterium]TDI63429.1 MAG: thiamine phosphate synthase [Alphaproteobacteria bacterium]
MTESCRLYLITPERLDPGPFADTLALALDAGEVACVQLRLKGIDDDAIRQAALTLAPVAQSRDVAFLLNDRPDLAAETGCDGVHVGQHDTSYDEARALVGDDAIVGVTCHDSRHFAMVAAERGADYVAFGAFYPTATKDAIGHPDAEILKWWSEMMTVPSVAIGGITAANCAPLVKAGADFIAVLSAVWSHAEGPGAAVEEFNKTIAEAQAAAP